MSGVSGFSNSQSNVNELKNASKAASAAAKGAEEAVEKASGEVAQQKNGKEDSSSVSKAGKASANIGIWDEKPTISKDTMKKLEEALKNIMKEPQAVVEEVRSSRGPARDEKLLHFGEKLDSMSTKELKTMRDHLVNEMASPKNNDDPLLGSMLKMVNKELDSRDNNHFPIFKDPFGHGKDPLIIKDPGIIKEPIDPGFDIHKDPFHKGPNKIDPGFSIDPKENLKKHIEFEEKFPHPPMTIQPFDHDLKHLTPSDKGFNIDPGIIKDIPEKFKNIDKGMIVDIPNPKNIEYK